MFTIGFTLIMMVAAVVAAIACVMTVVGAVQLTASRKHGYFHLVIPTMLITAGLSIALSGRAFDPESAQQLMEGVAKHPLAIWVQRIGTIVILTASAERLISHFNQQRPLLGAAPMLALGFIAYWMGSVASPMFLSAHPLFGHYGFYTLVIGLAALVLTTEEGETTLLTARNSLFVFQIISFSMLLPLPHVVLDTNYSQGLIPGLPRFAGLAPHANTLGVLAQISLLCLWARPYANRRLNKAAWILGLFTLILAQSKTAWISFTLCAVTMYVCQHGAALKQQLTDPERPQLGITLIVCMLAGLILFTAAALFGNLGNSFSHYLSSDSGASLTSLTGRDLIWAVAYDEWMRHPIFGYGPPFLDYGYRLSIGMPNAIHGHNQYMDLLPRAGLAGAIPLTFYLIAMLSLSIRHAVASRGLTLALFLAIGLRAISEIPLTLSGYGSEFIGHLLILILLPAYNAMQQQSSTVKPATENAFVRTSAQS